MVRHDDSVPEGRRFPIRFKLAAALAVPLVALLVVASTKVLQTRAAADEASDQAELALSATGPGSLVRALQTERNHTSAYLLDAESLVNIEPNAYLEARPATDSALTGFQQAIDGAGRQVQAAYQPAIDAMTDLGELRTQVDEYTGVRDLNNTEMMQEVFGGYADLVNELFSANRQVSLAVNDPVLRRGTTLVDLATRNSDTVAQLTRDLVFAAVGGDADGVTTSSEITRVASLLSQLRRNEDTIRENGVGIYRPFVEALFASEHTQRFPEAVQNALDTGVVDLGSLLGNAGDREAFGYDSLLEAVEQELKREAESQTDSAVWTQNFYTGFGVIMLLLGGLMTWLVSRSITRPLRSLTRQATAMANEHLPGAVLDILETPLGEDVTVPHVTPIHVRTRDEVSDVAEALNTVQNSALDLAVEQAVLRRNIADSFVNLGRRNQNLLSRQLDFITELERNETDPDSLASLFRLDHLATRMRRNAESLLVLAGIDPPRKWAAPVRLNDVIRAALSEIEDYQRVHVVAVEPATIVGSAAAGLAHLLAELMENAVTFSAPDQTVEVRGRRQGDAYTLAVIDSGLGMPPDEIERANRRLAGEESFTVAPSKYLGHYVTGNLAARHGIEVKLHNGAIAGGQGGITATINLPPALLTADQGQAGAPALRTAAAGARAQAAPAPQPALAGVAGMAAPGGPGSPGGPAGPGAGGPGGPGGPTVGAPPPRPQPAPAPAPAPGAAPSGPQHSATWEALASLPAFKPPAARPQGPSYTAPPSQPRGPEPPSAPGGPSFGAPPSGPAGPETAPLSFEAPEPRMPQAPPPFGAPPPGPAGPETAPLSFEAPEPRMPQGPPSYDTPQSWNQGPELPSRGQARPTWDSPSPPSSPPPGHRHTPAPPKFAPTPPRGTPSLPGGLPGPPPGGNGGQTQGGLTRRVRGAQIPNTQPPNLRRSPEPAPGQPPASSGRQQGRQGAGGQQTPADDVYSFLSSFQAGVQRGLDKAADHEPDDPDRPNGR